MRNGWVKIMCLLSVVASCAGQGYAAEPLQPMTIQLYWIPNVEVAGILVAKERGWYKEAGIDLTIKAWAEGIDPINEVVSGKAQIGVTDGAELIKARTQGKLIKAIAVGFQKSPFGLISKKEKGIETPEQLKGKRIGIAGSDTLLMAKIVLANKGLRAEDVTFIDAGWELQLLIDDKIDAYTGFMNDQPLILKAQGYEAVYIPAFKYGYDFYSAVYFTSDTILREQPELLQKFVEITRRGWQEAFKDPAATARLVVEKYYSEGSVSQQTESLKIIHNLATLGIGDKLVGFMEEQFWAKGIDILEKYQQIDKKILAKDVFTLEFLKKTASPK